MNEWGIPVSKEKIIARRNRLIEYQKVGELRFTPLYKIIDVNILDINYMLHEIENLQSKINKAIELGDRIIQEHEELVGLTGNLVLNFKQVLNILKEDK